MQNEDTVMDINVIFKVKEQRKQMSILKENKY